MSICLNYFVYVKSLFILFVYVQISFRVKYRWYIFCLVCVLFTSLFFYFFPYGPSLIVQSPKHCTRPNLGPVSTQFPYCLTRPMLGPTPSCAQHAGLPASPCARLQTSHLLQPPYPLAPPDSPLHPCCPFAHTAYPSANPIPCFTALTSYLINPYNLPSQLKWNPHLLKGDFPFDFSKTKRNDHCPLTRTERITRKGGHFSKIC